MKSFRKHRRAILVFTVTLALVWMLSSLVHEAAHGLTAQVLGGRFNWMCVWPGIQVLPRPGGLYDGEWGTSIAKLAYTTGPGWGTDSWQDGLVKLMGSGANLALAALALGSLWLFRPRGPLRTLLIAEALMFEDILLYTVGPELFGLPHYFFYGGSTPEPIDGAELLGCPRIVAVILILLASALMIGGLAAYLVRTRSARDPDELSMKGGV
jgi:hypothetical protein